MSPFRLVIFKEVYYLPFKIRIMTLIYDIKQNRADLSLLDVVFSDVMFSDVMFSDTITFQRNEEMDQTIWFS